MPNADWTRPHPLSPTRAGVAEFPLTSRMIRDARRGGLRTLSPDPITVTLPVGTFELRIYAVIETAGTGELPTVFLITRGSLHMLPPTARPIPPASR